MCKKIHRGGNAEQYNGDKKYKEAVAEAVEACADDTKGQMCYICTQALHWKTKEGLVRMCACRGTAGFAHVSCLAEQAKILMDEAEENNLDLKVQNVRWARWHTCRLCEQRYHGVVKCALGWACWKTYVGRPETDRARQLAMNYLGNGLLFAARYEDASSVKEAELSMMLRLGAPEASILTVQSCLAIAYGNLGQDERVNQIERDVYFGRLKLVGEEHEDTLLAANNYASTLRKLERFEEAKALLRKVMPVARRVLGEDNDLTLKMRFNYAKAVYARRVLGGAHPLTTGFESNMRKARAGLRARETPSGRG